MVTNRTTPYGVVVLLLIAAVSSCGDNSNPAAPSALLVTTGPLAALAPDGVVSLKTGKPVLRSPIDNTETLDLTPVLVIANSAPLNLPDFDFTYELEVYEVHADLTMTRVRHPKGIAQTPNSTGHAVVGDLEQATTHMWRARAEVGEEKGPWSDAATFQTPTLLGVPTPVSPINGATTTSTRPDLVVQNGDVPAGSSSVVYEFQLDDEGPTFPHPSQFSTPRDVGGQTTTQFKDALAPDTQLWWRVRATEGTVASDWSATQTFRTPDFSAGPRAPDPPPGQKLPLPDQQGLIIHLAATHAAALADSCIEEGGSWDFMDIAVEELRKTDTRWGYNCKRGDCGHISIDVVNYHWGAGSSQGSAQVYPIDIISAVCPGGSQSPSWTDQSAAVEAGAAVAWIFPRPGE